jgi:hypothetical protein
VDRPVSPLCAVRFVSMRAAAAKTDAHVLEGT